MIAPTASRASSSQPKAKSGVEKASSVARAPSGRSSQASSAAETGYPTIAESLGQKKGPPKKAAPSSKTTSAQPPMAKDTKGAATSGAVTTTLSGKAGSTSMQRQRLLRQRLRLLLDL